MPNVDDHGLEVLKKAARNIGAKPKTDYALQTILVSDESTGLEYSPQILNITIDDKDIEEEIDLPAGTKGFILKARKISRLLLSFSVGGTDAAWVTIPRGGYWIENKKIQNNKIFIQSNIDDNIIEIVAYI